MKLTMVGALVVAGLVVLVSSDRFAPGEAQAQHFAQQRVAVHDVKPAADLITLSAAAADEQGEQVQQVTIIDPKTRVMAVYHVKAKSGEIELKNVRKFDWDLQMEEFNAVSPLPREVRSQVAPDFRPK